MFELENRRIVSLTLNNKILVFTSILSKIHHSITKLELYNRNMARSRSIFFPLILYCVKVFLLIVEL